MGPGSAAPMSPVHGEVSISNVPGISPQQVKIFLGHNASLFRKCLS